MENVEKVIYPFIKSDGYACPCNKGCPNCTHCTDVFWDYTHGIYGCVCELYYYEHEGCCDDYVNNGTEPVTIEEFNAIKRKEMGWLI